MSVYVRDFYQRQNSLSDFHESFSSSFVKIGSVTVTGVAKGVNAFTPILSACNDRSWQSSIQEFVTTAVSNGRVS